MVAHPLVAKYKQDLTAPHVRATTSGGKCAGMVITKDIIDSCIRVA